MSGEGFNEKIFWESNSDGFFLVIQIESYFRQIYRGESSPSKFHLIATVWAKPGQNGRTWSYKKSKCPDDDSSSQGRSRIAPKNAVRCRSIMFKKNNQLTRVNPQAPANGEPSTGPIQSGRRKWDEEGLLTNLKKNLVNTKKKNWVPFFDISSHQGRLSKSSGRSRWWRRLWGSGIASASCVIVGSTQLRPAALDQKKRPETMERIPEKKQKREKMIGKRAPARFGFFFPAKTGGRL